MDLSSYPPITHIILFNQTHGYSSVPNDILAIIFIRFRIPHWKNAWTTKTFGLVYESSDTKYEISFQCAYVIHFLGLQKNQKDKLDIFSDISRGGVSLGVSFTKKISLLLPLITKFESKNTLKVW